MTRYGTRAVFVCAEVVNRRAVGSLPANHTPVCQLVGQQGVKRGVPQSPDAMFRGSRNRIVKGHGRRGSSPR